VDSGFNCSSCHDVHALELKIETCAACHAAASDPKNPATFNVSGTDWDGDGAAEGVKDEIATFGERLYAAILAYAKEKGTPITFDAHSSPYFFVDMDEDGAPDKNEQGANVRYNAFTPTLLKGAFNYQYWDKDPGNFAHNAKYIMQVLYDSIEELGGDTSGLTRP